MITVLIAALIAGRAFSVAGANATPDVSISFDILKQQQASAPLQGTIVARPPHGQGNGQSLRIGTEPPVLSGKPGSKWRVELAAPGWWMAPVDLTIPPSGSTIALRVWPAATISGSFSGIPADKMPASVKLLVEAPPWRRSHDRIERGTELPCVIQDGIWSCSVPSTTMDLAVVAAGYIREYRWNVHPRAGESLDVGAITLREGGSAAVWLSPDTREAAVRAGAWATIRRSVPADPSAVTQRLAQPVAKATFGANGIVQLAPLPAGEYVLEIGAKGFATTRIFPFQIIQSRETMLRRPVELARPIRVAARIDPAIDPHGRPWAATVLRASDFGGAYDREPVFNGRVPSSGEIHIPDQSPGRFRITITDGDGNAVATEELLALSDSDPSTSIDIAVVRVHGRIRNGTVPLAASLLFGGAQGVPRIRMLSDDTGEFSGWLPREGQWVVDVRSSDGALQTSLKTQVKEHRDLELSVAQTRVAGTVWTDDLPAEKAQVVLSDAAGLLLTAATDASGTFEFRGAPAGDYTVVASSRTGAASEPRAIDLPSESSTVEGIRLVLRRPGSIIGSVTGGGRPIALAHVHVFAGGTGTGAVTDVDGRFDISVPSHATRGLFVIRAPGRVLTVFDRSFDADLAFDVAANGGVVQFYVPEQLTHLRLLQNGAAVPLPLALSWAQTQGVAVRQNSVVTVPNVAIGEYRLCSVDDRSREQCAQGRLEPGATLSLTLP